MSENGSSPWSKAVTAEDAASALPLVRVAARWVLPSARWPEVGRLATAMLSALAVDNGQDMRAGIRDLVLLGPVRRMTQEVAVPAPGDVLSDLSALIDVLTELANAGGPAPPEAGAGGSRSPVSLPITIYLRDESGHEQVEQAVEDLLGLAGFSITEWHDPVLGSWFRRMRATLAGAARSQAGRAVLEAGALRADLELVQRPDAEVAALWMANIAPLLASLQNTESAVIYLGVVLIVKSGGKTVVYKLTTRQQLVLNNSPHLLAAPDTILRTLGLPADDGYPGGFRR